MIKCSRSNIKECCRVPFKLRNQRIIPSQRVRIFPWSEVYITSVRRARLSLSNSARRWCSIFCHSRVQIPNLGWISTSSFHACRWINYSTSLSCSKETQTCIICLESRWDIDEELWKMPLQVIFYCTETSALLFCTNFRNGRMGNGSNRYCNET